MSKLSDSQMDEIYDSMDKLMYAKSWDFIDGLLRIQFLPSNDPITNIVISNNDIHILLSYAVTTLSCKHKLKYRDEFISKCKAMYPDPPDLWKGLD